MIKRKVLVSHFANVDQSMFPDTESLTFHICIKRLYYSFHCSTVISSEAYDLFDGRKQSSVEKTWDIYSKEAGAGKFSEPGLTCPKVICPISRWLKSNQANLGTYWIEKPSKEPGSLTKFFVRSLTETRYPVQKLGGSKAKCAVQCSLDSPSDGRWSRCLA